MHLFIQTVNMTCIGSSAGVYMRFKMLMWSHCYAVIFAPKHIDVTKVCEDIKWAKFLIWVSNCSEIFKSIIMQ